LEDEVGQRVRLIQKVINNLISGGGLLLVINIRSHASGLFVSFEDYFPLAIFFLSSVLLGSILIYLDL